MTTDAQDTTRSTGDTSGRRDTSLASKASSITDDLAAALRFYITDEGWSSTVSTRLRDLLDLVPALQDELQQVWLRRLAEWIELAAGNAATHSWEITERGQILCTVCRTNPGTGHQMTLGQVPVCTPNPGCEHFVAAVSAQDQDHSRCIYCREIYPTTAVEASA